VKFVQVEVRAEISVDYSVHDPLGCTNDRVGTYQPHLPHQGIKLDEVCHIVFLVTERISEEARRLGDEFPEERFAFCDLALAMLLAVLRSLRQPGCCEGCQCAYSDARQSKEG
jgi:hypothetical protein